MVKLARILKSEYRDVSPKSNRKSPLKKRGARDPDRVSQTLATSQIDASPRGDASQGTSKKEVNLPPAMLRIVRSHPSGHSLKGHDEEREQAEPPRSNASGTKPHHFALTHAAQMALRSVPMAEEADDRSHSSTMALIDSILKTSDDPALIEALQAMIAEAGSKSVQQRETLALVAESIMEKKAAKEALQRAVLAESRLHESLKKCAPDLVNDAAAVVAAAEVNSCISVDAPSPSVASNTLSPGGFFNRINRSLTATSQNGHRRIGFAKSKALNRIAKNKGKSEKKSGKDPTAKIDAEASYLEIISASRSPGAQMKGIGTLAGEVGLPSDEAVSGGRFKGSPHRFSPTREDKDEENEDGEEEDGEVQPDREKAEEGRDDKEQACEQRETELAKSNLEAASIPAKRWNKYKYITSVEPESRHKRSLGKGSRSSNEAGDHGTFVSTLGPPTHTDTYNPNFAIGGAAVETQVEVFTSLEGRGGHDGIFVEVDEASDGDSEAYDPEKDHDEDEENDGAEVEADDPTISNFKEDDAEKIEYTIFELESKVSISTYASSVASSSAESVHSKERMEVEQADNETLDKHTDEEDNMDENEDAEEEEEEEDEEEEEEEGEEGEEVTACDEVTFREDEATINEGEETGASGAESRSGSDDRSSDDDDDDDALMFASFCQRPNFSFGFDTNNDDDDDDDDDDSNSGSGRRRRRRKEVKKVQDMTSILKCVSGYFAGDDDAQTIREKKHRRRRRRRRHHRRSAR